MRTKIFLPYLLCIFAIIYFIITTIVFLKIAWTPLNSEEINITKNILELDTENLIFIYTEPFLFKPNLGALYFNSNNRIQNKVVYCSDNSAKEIEIIYKIKNNNVVKYLWYSNIVIILLVIIIFRKNSCKKIKEVKL